jgi:hypothetical protein
LIDTLKQGRKVRKTKEKGDFDNDDSYDVGYEYCISGAFLLWRLCNAMTSCRKGFDNHLSEPGKRVFKHNDTPERYRFGLIICTEFTENNRGHITIERALRKGSKISFSVPLQSH